MAGRLPVAMAILLGVATFAYLHKYNQALQQNTQAASAVCFADLSKPDPNRPSFFRFHIPGLDHFNCLLTPFFKEGMAAAPQLLVTRELVALFAVVLALCAVESLRPGASGFVSLYPAVALFSQLVGVSIAFPWAWLSSYWIKNQTRVYAHLKSTTPADEPSPRPEPNPTKVLGVSVAMVLVAMPFFFVTFWPVPDAWLLELLLAVFNPLPPLLCLLWVVLPGNKQGAVGVGHARVKLLFYVLAGLAYLMHLWALSTLFVPGFRLEELLPVFAGVDRSLAASHFLFIDLAVLFVACTWWVALEPLRGSLVPFLVLTVLLGPGTALALFMVRREKVLAQGAAPVKRD